MNFIYHLLHLLALAFAVGLAYLSLERFRYASRILNLAYESVTKIRNLVPPEKEKTLEEDKKRILEAALTRIEQITEKTKNGRGWKIGERRLLGSPRKGGWDVWIIRFFLMANFVFLVYGSVFPFNWNPYLEHPYICDNVYQAAVFVSILGTIIPALIIACGNHIVRKTEKTLEENFDTVQESFAVKVGKFIEGLKSKIEEAQKLK